MAAVYICKEKQAQPKKKKKEMLSRKGEWAGLRENWVRMAAQSG